MTESFDPLWNTQKVADYFAVEPSTVLRWMQEGELRAKKVNNRWKVHQSEVYRFRDAKYAQGAH